MQSIKAKWGDQLSAMATSSSVPAAFLAALIAGESGGDAEAKRFEPSVFSALGEVVIGRRSMYGSIGAMDILKFVSVQAVPPAAIRSQTDFANELTRFAHLAHSWGLTQVMGYEVIPFRLDGIAALQSPMSGLNVTLAMLNQFAYHNHLDITKDFAELFNCWNTGRPHSPTHDPNYIPNGLGRMKIYEALP